MAQGPEPRERSSISNVDLVAVVVDVKHIKGFFWEGQGRALRDLCPEGTSWTYMVPDGGGGSGRPFQYENRCFWTCSSPFYVPRFWVHMGSGRCFEDPGSGGSSRRQPSFLFSVALSDQLQCLSWLAQPMFERQLSLRVCCGNKYA